MIMDSDAVEACLLAADDERGKVRQRSPNGDSEIDADPGHLTKAPLFSIPTIRSFRRNENRAKRFLRRDASGRARHWPACRRVRFHGEFAIGSTWKEKNAYVFAASAAFTRSGVIGYWRSLTPVASKNALAIAAAVAPMTSSPAPVEGSSSRCTTTAVLRMLGEAQHRIRHPIEAGDAALVERHLLLEHAARRLDRLPDDLVLDQAGIDHLARVERAVNVRSYDVG